MKRLLTILPMLFAAGCVSAPGGSLEAFCTASEPAIRAHAAALAVTPDEAALRTGDLVIRQHDAGCGK
jgi:hypothetical protein